MEHRGRPDGGHIVADSSGVGPSRPMPPAPARRVVHAGGRAIGRDFVLIAGPCAVESFEQTLETARRVKAAGAHMLRGGAYKPRTSPFDFQGLGAEALDILAAARAETGLPVVTEVMDPRQIEQVGRVADVFQVGSRS